MAYGNGKFVAVSADGDNRVMTAASCTTPGPATCGSPANTIGQPLMITGVTDVSCATGSFRIVTSGGTGQPINFGGIVGLNNADAFNCVRTVDGAGVVRAINNPASDIEPFSLRGMQSGGPASNVFRFDFTSLCGCYCS